MSDTHLWQQLKGASLVSGDQPDHEKEPESTLWYIRILQGFAGWLAALFLIGFLGFGVAGLFDHGIAMIILGVVINLLAGVYFKTAPDSDFFEQLVLVFSLTGQFLFAFGLFELNDFKDHQWMVVIGLYQVILVFVMNNYLHRFLSTWFAVIALFWGYELLIYSGLGSALVAALFVWLWLDKVGWEKDRNYYEPIAYALGFTLLHLNIHNHYWIFDLFRYGSQSNDWWLENAYWVSALLNSAILIYFVCRMVQEHKISYSSTVGRLVILAAVVMLFSALPVIGLSSALLILLVGFARQSKILMVMGVLALLGFVGWYYYSLQQTLLFKSLVLIGIGVTLVLGHVLLRKILTPSNSNAGLASQSRNPSVTWWQKLAVAATLLLALIGVNHAIWQKESLLENGQSVFLELAPVDPRSIMQGDYMRLRFAIANQIRSNLPDSTTPGYNANHDGYVMVKLDENMVAQFESLMGTQHENQDWLKMKYRVRSNRIQFATNAFFFQEGDAPLFDAARFGEFKVAEDGDMLLKAMYDKDLKLLGENRLD
ncbi:MAG: GDYXXLXY domain-containing protein [Marinicella sp.]